MQQSKFKVPKFKVHGVQQFKTIPAVSSFTNVSHTLSYSLFLLCLQSWLTMADRLRFGRGSGSGWIGIGIGIKITVDSPSSFLPSIFSNYSWLSRLSVFFAIRHTTPSSSRYSSEMALTAARIRESSPDWECGYFDTIPTQNPTQLYK